MENKAKHPWLDLTGQKFGRLKVIGPAPRNPIYSCRQWRCLCECGNEIIVNSPYLRRGLTRSCGCLSREHMYAVGKAAKTHGYTANGKRLPEYESYLNAKKRCNYPRHPKYHYYGGRGIKFLFESFEQFIAHVGNKPTPKHSIDRIDNDGNYEIGNVKWSTQKEQIANRRRGKKTQS